MSQLERAAELDGFFRPAPPPEVQDECILPKPAALEIFYLAHDLDDPAIARRATQLRRGGAKVGLAGFRRRSSSYALPQGVVAGFGQTVDGRLGRRVVSITMTALRVGVWGRAGRGCDVLLARSLEMLVLGALLRATFCKNTPLVYECLDVHRMMVSPGIPGRALRLLERRLLRSCALLMTSSPAFVDHYFRPFHGIIPPVLLWENRILASEFRPEKWATRPDNHAPWRIGWFGMIRCERSLQLLQGLCRSLPGHVEVEVRGRPTRELLPKLTEAAVSTPGLTFGGPYERSRDLRNMYGRVHFTWAIDFFEDGANSAWLLPNRLYEGGAHSAVPIAVDWVETGRWLGRHASGVLLSKTVEKDLILFFRSLDTDRYQALVDGLTAVDPRAFCQSDDELVDIVERLAALTLDPACQKIQDKR